jgi:hypothetical protein
MAFAVLQRFSENGDAIEALAQLIDISDSSFLRLVQSKDACYTTRPPKPYNYYRKSRAEAHRSSQF